jgi:hypothetical protein
MDELAVFTAGYNLAQSGRADINQLIWTNHWTPNPPGVWGRDNNLYTKKPPGISFISAPLLKLGTAFTDLNMVHLGLLTNSVITALTASLLLIWLLDLGFSRLAATLATLGYGLGTIAWVYARMFWESSVLALCFLAAVWTAYRAVYLTQPQQRQWWLLGCGLSVGISLSLRFEAALIIFLIGLYLVAPQLDQDSGAKKVKRIARLILAIIIYVLPSVLIGLGLMYFNIIRFGSLTETGYTQEIRFDEPWIGVFGLLFSPGRGLFIYAPITVLLFLGLRPAWQRLPRLYFWLIGSISLCYLAFYGSWFAWGGPWGWGPRFLLPILPLLMLFVIEPLEMAIISGSAKLSLILLRIMISVLAVLSLTINLLGILVDFNEHFLRLGTNANFVFNWSAFPPLAHWQILQKGLVDVMWLQPYPQGMRVEWSILWPGLLLAMLATLQLVMVYKKQEQTKKGILPKIFKPYFSVSLLFLLALALTYGTLRSTSQIALVNIQTQADLPVLATLASTARPGDTLLLAMPPFGDVQEISTRLMAYLPQPLPTYAWIESEPRAIQPAEREKIWQAVQAETQRVWLFERWLTQGAATMPTAIYLNQNGFVLWEQWYEKSGKLSLYALAGKTQPLLAMPLNVSFQGGLTLVDFAVVDTAPQPGEVLKLRLTWQAAAMAELAAQDIPGSSIVAFTQLLTRTAENPIAQNDRLLVNLQNYKQSPLLPGQTVSQGYGLQLPSRLEPGNYPLIVGLYLADNGQRLQRADGSPDDFLYLTTVHVK